MYNSICLEYILYLGRVESGCVKFLRFRQTQTQPEPVPGVYLEPIPVLIKENITDSNPPHLIG